MHDQTTIWSATVEYEALRILMQALKKSDYDIPEILMERQTALVRALIDVPAGTTYDLAYKATVLLDWAEPEDVSGALTVSLCRDTVRLFPVAERLSGRPENVDTLLDTSRSLSDEDLVKLAQLFIERS